MVLGLYLSIYKVTDETPLYLLITSGQIKDIYPYRCRQNIGLTSSTLAQHCLVSGSKLVFAGMNITFLCENMLFFGFLVQHKQRILTVLYSRVTYKPKWTGYDLAVIFIPSF